MCVCVCTQTLIAIVFFRQNTKQTDECGEPASNTETVTFKKKIKINCVEEREKEKRRRKPRGGKRRLERGEKERAEGGVVCPDAGEERRRRRGTGYSPGRGLFYMNAPADSSGQEFRSSFCHRAYTPDHL